MFFGFFVLFSSVLVCLFTFSSLFLKKEALSNGCALANPGLLCWRPWRTIQGVARNLVLWELRGFCLLVRRWKFGGSFVIKASFFQTYVLDSFLTKNTSKCKFHYSLTILFPSFFLGQNTVFSTQEKAPRPRALL